MLLQSLSALQETMIALYLKTTVKLNLNWLFKWGMIQTLKDLKISILNWFQVYCEGLSIYTLDD